MKRLNYHHLFYFWNVARSGSVSKASRELHVAQPTVSEQIHSLEKELGRRLLQKSGRNLELTDSGKLVLRYAKRIFRAGEELSKAVTKKQESARRGASRRKNKK